MGTDQSLRAVAGRFGGARDDYDDYDDTIRSTAMSPCGARRRRRSGR